MDFSTGCRDKHGMTIYTKISNRDTAGDRKKEENPSETALLLPARVQEE